MVRLWFEDLLFWCIDIGLARSSITTDEEEDLFEGCDDLDAQVSLNRSSGMMQMLRAEFNFFECFQCLSPDALRSGFGR